MSVLGFFQADLPIGRRLWLLLIAMVLSVILFNSEFDFSGDPLTFAVRMLSYFGYVTIIGLALSLLYLPVMVFGYFRSLFSTGPLTFWDTVRSLSWYDRGPSILADIAFVCAAFVAAPLAPLLGSNAVVVLGVIGLALLVLVQISASDDTSHPNIELLELRKNETGTMSAQFILEGKPEAAFPIKLEWVLELDTKWNMVLDTALNNGWEIVNSTEDNSRSKVLLKRKIGDQELAIRRNRGRRAVWLEVPNNDRHERT